MYLEDQIWKLVLGQLSQEESREVERLMLMNQEYYEYYHFLCLLKEAMANK